MTENNDYSYLLDILKLAESGDSADSSEKLNIRYEGEFFTGNNVSRVNLNFAYVLLKDSSYETSLGIKDAGGLNHNEHKLFSDHMNKDLADLDFVISHNPEPSFNLPEKGRWIVMQNWDFGSVPEKWLESINDYVDELWVSSEYNKNCYIESSVPPEKIRVVHSGVDSLNFNPHITPIEVSTQKKIKFLFKGDLGWKTGFDLFLKAYSDEFVRDEDVCLIIVSDSKNISPENKELIKSFTDNPDWPEILLIDLPEDEKQMAQLYKSSSYFAYPYRAESYCLDLLEAMACGTPALVTGYGAALDYCNAENSILIQADRTYQSEKMIEGLETRAYPFWADVEIMNLRVKLREAYELNEENYKELSRMASRTILDKFTWVKLNDSVKEELRQLKKDAPASTPEKREIQKQLNLKTLEGLKLLSLGNFDEALVKLKEAYALDNKNASANFYLANVSLAKGNYSDALTYMINSLANSAVNDDYINLTGIILYKMGHYALAGKFFEKTLRLNPGHAGALESLKAVGNISAAAQNPVNYPLTPEQTALLNEAAGSSSGMMTALPTLSVCILARNEQKTIEKAIKSVKKVADEIIVLDTGSDDKTIEIAQKEGVQVFTTQWNQDFAQARNEIMRYAKMDWILMLDADEELSPDSAERIKPTLLKCSPAKIYLPRIINLLDKHGGQEQMEHYVVRLIPNSKDIKYIRSIHEFPVAADESILSSENLKGIDIIHHGYSLMMVKEKNKIQRNRTILENMLNQAPADPLNYFYLAENYKDDENYERVNYYSTKVLELCRSENLVQYNHLIVMSQVNIIESLMVLDKLPEAKEKAEEFRESLSQRPDFWFLYGSIELDTGNPDRAIEYQNKALKLRDKDVFPALDIGTVTWKPLTIIAKAYKTKEDYKNAIIYYKKALKESPANLALYYELAKLYATTGELKLMENTLTNFLNILENKELISIIKFIAPVYFEQEMGERLYNLLETVRKFRLRNNVQHTEMLNELSNELITLYDKILEKSPGFLAAKYSIGCCYSFTGNYEQAEKAFEQVLDSDEFEVDSLHNMASIALNRKDLEKAEQLYKKVLEIDEFHVETYISLTKLSIKTSNIEKAKEYLNELETIDPDNKEISILEFEMANQSGNRKLAADMYAAMLFRNMQ
jgi:tetratricopeptide (TPR) repeat protein